jgi:hypothetical protein
MKEPEAIIGQSAQEGILVLEVPVWGSLGDSCPFGKQAQTEYLCTFGFQGLKAQPQELFAQVAVVVGIGGFQRRPPVIDRIAMVSLFILQPPGFDGQRVESPVSPCSSS